MVHGAGGIHTGFVAGNGLGIAVLEHDGQIGEGGAGNAGALCTQGHHLLQLGHHIVCHLIAEFPDLLRAVADAVIDFSKSLLHIFLFFPLRVNASSYKAVYYVEPQTTDHPTYQINRKIVVKEADQQKDSQSESSSDQDAGSSDKTETEDSEADSSTEETDAADTECSEAESE